MSDNPCRWHISGVPDYAFGKRFFGGHGCRRCAEKLAAGAASESDPRPDDFASPIKYGSVYRGSRREARLARIAASARRHAP